MDPRRILTVLLIAIALLVPVSVHAEDAATPSLNLGTATPVTDTGPGSVTGTVNNGTPGGDSAAGVTVTLSRFRGANLVQEYQTTADEDGRYTFTDLPVNDGEAYVATATYKDVRYTSSMIQLTNQEAATADITVYETTTDPGVISVVSRGIVIAAADRETGNLELFEILSLDNTSDRAYIGQDGTVLRVPLPEGATQIIPQPGFDFGEPRVDEGALITTGPVAPGSHDVMYAYLVPYTGSQAVLNFGTAMPTDSLSVLVQEGTFEISSPALQDAGTADISGSKYHVLSTQQPVVGDVVAVTVSGLPKPGASDSSRGPLYAALAASVGLLAAGGLVFQTIRRRRDADASPAAEAEPDGSDALEDERLELAAELNRLDDERAAGRIDEETYQQERGEILEELRAISQRMRGLEDAGI